MKKYVCVCGGGGGGEVGGEALKAKHYVFVGGAGGGRDCLFVVAVFSIQWAVGFCENV